MKLKMNDTEKTETILNALLKKYCSWGMGSRFVQFPELRLGSGFSDISQRRVDLFEISSEKGNYTFAYEIKVSRGDFLKDIKNPLKQRGARLYSSYFYYVAPSGLIKIEEVPLWAGLIEYDFETENLKKVVEAPLFNRENPSWSLICSLVRRVNSGLYETEIEEQRSLLRMYKYELKSLYRALKQLKEYDLDEKMKEIVIATALNSAGLPSLLTWDID